MNSQIISILERNKQAFINAAQRVYDEWEQDEEGHDEEYGYGGICDNIAAKFGSIIGGLGLNSFTKYNEYDYHTSAYAYQCPENEDEQGILIQVDIHPFTYEKGAGYTWTKIPNVKFDASDVTIFDMSGYFENYVDGDCEMIEESKNYAKKVVITEDQYKQLKNL